MKPLLFLMPGSHPFHGYYCRFNRVCVVSPVLSHKDHGGLHLLVGERGVCGLQ
jgi:hypothetical protein